MSNFVLSFAYFGYLKYNVNTLDNFITFNKVTNFKFIRIFNNCKYDNFYFYFFTGTQKVLDDIVF